jgi:hypothetical protein
MHLPDYLEIQAWTVYMFPEEGKVLGTRDCVGSIIEGWDCRDQKDWVPFMGMCIAYSWTFQGVECLRMKT